MVSSPPAARTPAPASPWQPLDYANAIHAPDTYGVLLIADSRQEPILISAGVLRDEVWRILNDPLAKANGAAFFRVVPTLIDTEAEKLAEEMYRQAGRGDARLRWRHFPSPEPPAEPAGLTEDL